MRPPAGGSWHRLRHLPAAIFAPLGIADRGRRGKIVTDLRPWGAALKTLGALPPIPPKTVGLCPTAPQGHSALDPFWQTHMHAFAGTKGKGMHKTESRLYRISPAGACNAPAQTGCRGRVPCRGSGAEPHGLQVFRSYNPPIARQKEQSLRSPDRKPCSFLFILHDTPKGARSYSALALILLTSPSLSIVRLTVQSELFFQHSLKNRDSPSRSSSS